MNQKEDNELMLILSLIVFGVGVFGIIGTGLIIALDRYDVPSASWHLLWFSVLITFIGAIGTWWNSRG
jgi:hypothetical protein